MARLFGFAFSAALLLAPLGELAAAEELPAQAKAALQKAVQFYSQQVADHGGYVYQYSADLKKREGEGVAPPGVNWIQPPGTPTVGLAYVEAWLRTGDESCLQAAKETAHALVHGQLKSGGWDSSMVSAGPNREKFDFRTEDGKNPSKRKLNNFTTLDDNKTQSALLFLIRYDEATGFKDKVVHEAVLYGLDHVIAAQYPNGAWPQRFSGPPNAAEFPVRKASFPAEWSRKFEGKDYKSHYTLNDNTQADTIGTLMVAAAVYDEPRYRQAALKGVDFFILAQLPEPQPGWAQQYDAEMHPAWARKFEPPAITGSESRNVLYALIAAYHATGDKKYLEPIPRALEFYRGLVLDDGRMARFYEMNTSKPLYFTKDYVLTYSDADVPTHYGFKVSNWTDSVQQRYAQAQQRGPKAPELSWSGMKQASGRPSSSQEKEVRQLIEGLDDRGAWVEEGTLRYHGDDDPTREIIASRTFAKNLQTLARYVQAAGN